MADWTPGADEIITEILAVPPRGRRRMVAIAGPPASGKSTLAATLVTGLTAQGHAAVLVPMDGFHLDNAVLDRRGLRTRKGAPETFDADGFLRLIRAAAQEDEAVFPVFDRSRDIAIAGAGVIEPAHETVVVEGNYLLLERQPWQALADLWDYATCLEVPADVLRARLIARWLAHGDNEEDAIARAEGNDLPNARITRTESRTARRIIAGSA